MSEQYLPGYGPRTSRMLTARTLASRAPLTAARLPSGARVVDVGCGPATITAGIADRVGPSGRVTALDASAAEIRAARETITRPGLHYAAGSVHALPLPDGATDVAFAHAVFEHLTDPRAALAELARILRRDGLLALISSDWSGAAVDPPDPDVACAVDGYRRVRRAAGADPDMGTHLEGLVTAAGFGVLERRSEHRQDMVGADLAHYVHERLAPPTTTDAADASPVADARRAALRWVRHPAPSTVHQHWVEVVAERR